MDKKSKLGLKGFFSFIQPLIFIGTVLLVITAIAINRGLASRITQTGSELQQLGSRSISSTIATNKVDQTAAWTVYNNKVYGFEMKYPRDWFAYDEDRWERDNNVTRCDPQISIKNTVILSRKDLGSCVGFVVWEQWPGEFIISISNKEWPNFPHILSNESAEIKDVSGVPAVKYPFTEESELPRKQTTRIYINHDGKGYLIEFLQTDRKGSYDPIYDQIISTLNFNR